MPGPPSAVRLAFRLWTPSSQLTLNGLTEGSTYALIALGYTLVYGVLKLLNFAHGDVFMVGSFIGFGVLKVLGGAGDPKVPGLAPADADGARRHGRLRHPRASPSSASPTGPCATRHA